MTAALIVSVSGLKLDGEERRLLEKMQPERINPLSDKQIHAEFVLRESMGPARKE